MYSRKPWHESSLKTNFTVAVPLGPSVEYTLPRFPRRDHPSAGETPRSFLAQERERVRKNLSLVSHSLRLFAFLGGRRSRSQITGGMPPA